MGMHVTDHSIRMFHEVIVLLKYFDLFLSSLPNNVGILLDAFRYLLC